MHPQMDVFNAFSMFATGNVTLKAQVEIFGSSISLSKSTSIKFHMLVFYQNV